MDKCENCKHAAFYIKPVLPVGGWRDEVVGERKGLLKYILGKNVYGINDKIEKFIYEHGLSLHNDYVQCNALPETFQKSKTSCCSLFKEAYKPKLDF